MLVSGKGRKYLVDWGSRVPELQHFYIYLRITQDKSLPKILISLKVIVIIY